MNWQSELHLIKIDPTKSLGVMPQTFYHWLHLQLFLCISKTTAKIPIKK